MVAVKIKHFTFFLFLSFLLFDFPLVSQAQQVSAAHYVNQPVAAVQVSGNSRVADDVIRLQVQTQPGDPFEPQKVSDDIKNIFLTGYFEQVSAKVKNSPSGIFLLFLVKEKPSIRAFKISGADKVSEKEIKEKIGFDENAFLDKSCLLYTSDAADE